MIVFTSGDINFMPLNYFQNGGERLYIVNYVVEPIDPIYGKFIFSVPDCLAYYMGEARQKDSHLIYCSKAYDRIHGLYNYCRNRHYKVTKDPQKLNNARFVICDDLFTFFLAVGSGCIPIFSQIANPEFMYQGYQY